MNGLELPNQSNLTRVFCLVYSPKRLVPGNIERILIETEEISLPLIAIEPDEFGRSLYVEQNVLGGDELPLSLSPNGVEWEVYTTNDDWGRRETHVKWVEEEKEKEKARKTAGHASRDYGHGIPPVTCTLIVAHTHAFLGTMLRFHLGELSELWAELQEALHQVMYMDRQHSRLVFKTPDTKRNWVGHNIGYIQTKASARHLRSVASLSPRSGSRDVSQWLCS